MASLARWGVCSKGISQVESQCVVCTWLTSLIIMFPSPSVPECIKCSGLLIPAQYLLNTGMTLCSSINSWMCTVVPNV